MQFRLLQKLAASVFFSALVSASATTGSADVSANGPLIFKSGPRRPASNRQSDNSARALSESTDPSWSGYADGPGTFYSASGNWTVPSVSYIKYADNYVGPEYSSIWVGIGGNGSDQSLIQLGTEQTALADGTIKYYAWYLLVNGTQNTVVPLPSDKPVRPGDQVYAALNCQTNCKANQQQGWLLSIRNISQGWSWQQAVQYPSSLGSAEWIVERPFQTGVTTRLPKFGSVSFTDLVRNGQVVQLGSSYERITMTDGGTPIAQPSAPTGQPSFTVTQNAPSSSPMPGAPARLHCSPGVSFGELSQGKVLSSSGTLTPYVPVSVSFYVTKYSAINPLSNPSSYFHFVQSDLLGENLETNRSPYPLTIDPGYYCLVISNPQGAASVPFQFAISAGSVPLFPGTTRPTAQNLGYFELGNLSSNGHYGETRYINLVGRNGGYTPPTYLTTYHQYVIRDWIGPNASDQWYSFRLETGRKVSLVTEKLYLSATTTLENETGAVVGATSDNGLPAQPSGLLPIQTFEGNLTAGLFYVHVHFGGVGGPGTPFATTLIVQ